MKAIINNKQDAEELQDYLIKHLEHEEVFEVLETGEETVISDLLYNVDWNDFESLTLIK